MHWNAVRSLWPAFALAALALASCKSGGNDLTGGASSYGGSGSVAFTGCGIACDDQNPCTGDNMVCLPSSKGGRVCKPNICPACGDDKFCVFNNETCLPDGCSSVACGFLFLDACDDCVKANCCAKSKACADDPGCVSLNNCTLGCTTDDCRTACQQSAGAGAFALLEAAAACLSGACEAECYESSSSSSSGGSGCPDGYPVACPGKDYCCPSQWPVCNGACGYECCESSGSSSSSSSGGTGCPDGYPVPCPGQSFCCPSQYPVCGGCGYDCCPSGGSSSSSGGTTQCHNLTGCVTATSWTMANGTSCAGSELFASITNNCGQAAYCRLCAMVNGVVDQGSCGASSIQAGATQSGESGGWWWCKGQSVQYSCAAATDPTSCVQF